MFHVTLFEPEIPPNTGNIIRLCANAGFSLHLIAPLGFQMDDRALRRAGLDYHEYTSVQVHQGFQAFRDRHARARIIAFSTRGVHAHAEITYRPGDVLLFGPETRGLPTSVLDTLAPADVARIPMCPGGRSLNLSNAVAVAGYEAWRQNGFAGAS